MIIRLSLSLALSLGHGDSTRDLWPMHYDDIWSERNPISEAAFVMRARGRTLYLLGVLRVSENADAPPPSGVLGQFFLSLFSLSRSLILSIPTYGLRG